jgi:hypothetical protein
MDNLVLLRNLRRKVKLDPEFSGLCFQRVLSQSQLNIVSGREQDAGEVTYKLSCVIIRYVLHFQLWKKWCG